MSEQLKIPIERIIKRDKIVTPNTHIHDRTLVWLGTGTLINRGRVKPVLIVQTFLLLKWSGHASVLQAWISYTIKVASTPFGCIAPKTLIYLAFQSFDFERTWWRLFQKRASRALSLISTFLFKYSMLVFIQYVSASNNCHSL